MQFEMFVFLLLLSLLLILPVCWTSTTCIAKCTSELVFPHSMSSTVVMIITLENYEQYCCNDNNTGKIFKIRQNNVLKIIFCREYPPISCEIYHTYLNCLDIF